MANFYNVQASVMNISNVITTSASSYFSRHKKNQRLELKLTQQIAYLEKGAISMYRVGDDVLTITICAPAIIGLAQMRFPMRTHYIRCNSECDLYLIDIDEAIQLFTEKNVWQDAYDIMAKHLNMYFEREKMSAKRSNKYIVLEHLRKIWTFDEETRKKISVYTYILSRNFISRSGIHKTLKDLMEKEVVSLQRGKLLHFDESRLQ